MSFKLKPITETSWLVLGDTEDTKIGLLTEVRTQYILMAKGVKQQFLNRKEVTTFFNEDIFQNVVEPKQEMHKKKDYYINGYPVDFDNPHEVILKGNSLPLYSKKESSEVYYAAGYFCLQFPKDVMPSFCPKLATLDAYEYSGPFKDELAMRAELSRLRKLRNTKT
jgi:hypothetical protein